MFTQLGMITILAAAAAPAAHAQEVGRIVGTVVDQQLRPLPNTEVILATRTRSDTTRSAADGSFSFGNVPRGRAVVVARKEGYAATDRYAVRVSPGQEYAFEVRLYPTAGAARTAFDPKLQHPGPFTEPRGFHVALSLGVGSVVTAVSEDDVRGSATSYRFDLGHEFDSNWIGFLRFGSTSVRSKNDLRFRFNAQNTLTFRNYNVQGVDLGIQFAFRSNDKRLRPYGAAFTGLSRFHASVPVTGLDKPANARSTGIVVGLGAGVQYAIRYHITIDAGVEASATAFEEWHFNGGPVGFPTLSELPTEFRIAVRYWPFAR